MKTRNFLLTTTLVVCGATALLAELSPEKAAWAKGPVQFLMTPDEMTRWNSVQTDADAGEFITTFWTRRDPTPGTPANEYQGEFERRVAYADANFGASRLRGSLTDRGKTWVLFGRPVRVQRSEGDGPASARRASNEPYTADNSGTEVWTYEGDYAQKLFSLPTVELRFVDRFKTRDFQLETTRVIDLARAQQRVIAAFLQPAVAAASAAIGSPTLTKAPAQQTVAVPMPETAAPATTLKTAALESAIADARSGKVPGKGATITFAEFVAPTGEYYVPIGLFVPASAGLSGDATDTFFGVIEDANGKRVEVFEDPAKGMLSRNNLLFDRTVTLPSGKYTATFGLAKAGAPILIASALVELNVVSKEATGTSKLILSDIVETMEAAPVSSPFAFGRLKIVPRVLFGTKDELGYFVEVHNPGIDSATNLPKLQTRVDLVPPSGPTISAPLSDVQALPLSGAPGPGQYAIISAIPLSELKSLAPGDYALRIKIVDTVTKQSYTVEQKFRIAG